VSDILAAIDAATANLCACGCQQPLPQDGPSAYFAGPDCQRRWNETQTERPHDVYLRVDAAPYPPGPMRWRPDLVTADPDPNLQPVDRPELAYHGQHNATVYQHASRDLLHLRLDDGHRWVGSDLAEERATDQQAVADMWRRLERELGNTRHMAPADDPWAGLWETLRPSNAVVALPEEFAPRYTFDRSLTTPSVIILSPTTGSVIIRDPGA
jgi:hypothetical protein